MRVIGTSDAAAEKRPVQHGYPCEGDDILRGFEAPYYANQQKKIEDPTCYLSMPYERPHSGDEATISTHKRFQLQRNVRLAVSVT